MVVIDVPFVEDPIPTPGGEIQVIEGTFSATLFKRQRGDLETLGAANCFLIWTNKLTGRTATLRLSAPKSVSVRLGERTLMFDFVFPGGRHIDVEDTNIGIYVAQTEVTYSIYLPTGETDTIVRLFGIDGEMFQPTLLYWLLTN